jgi:hypothetical protein
MSEHRKNNQFNKTFGERTRDLSMFFYYRIPLSHVGSPPLSSRQETVCEKSFFVSLHKMTSVRRCTAFSYLEGDPELAYFAIYDGHGGTGVANYLKDHLHEFILNQSEYQEGNMEEAIVKAFLQVSQSGFFPPKQACAYLVDVQD